MRNAKHAMQNAKCPDAHILNFALPVLHFAFSPAVHGWPQLQPRGGVAEAWRPRLSADLRAEALEVGDPHH